MIAPSYYQDNLSETCFCCYGTLIFSILSYVRIEDDRLSFYFILFYFNFIFSYFLVEDKEEV